MNIIDYVHNSKGLIIVLQGESKKSDDCDMYSITEM
jgi:hypothetical protein